MNLLDLTISQLKRAAAIKEQIAALNDELRGILGGAAKSGAPAKKTPTTSVFGQKSVAAKPATLVKPAAQAQKKEISAATRARLSAKLKAFWAAKRAGKK